MVDFFKSIFAGLFEKVWLVTDNVLVVSPVELEFLSDGLTFNYVDYKAQLSANGHSRAVMGGVSYPDGYDVLGNWNEMGFLIICCLKSWIYPVLFREMQ